MPSDPRYVERPPFGPMAARPPTAVGASARDRRAQSARGQLVERYERTTCRPSDGWTRTQPWPDRASWTLSPEPMPISDLACTSPLRLVDTPPDHAIAACGSTNV